MSTVLIIDDQSTSRMIMEEVVRSVEGVTHVQAFPSPMEALKWAKSHPPDLVLTDYKMPHMDGAEFTQWLRKIPACADIPLVIITGVDEKPVRYRALEAGATDFLTKPIDHHECRARCRNLLLLRQQQQIIKERAKWLERRVNDAVQEIRDREKETLLRLARAGEYRDEGTGNHVLRMAAYARLIAEGLGLGEDECDLIEKAAPMHDVGKIGIPDRVLGNATDLSPDDWEIMKTHVTIGYDILRGSPSTYLKTGAIVALRHHERYNGEGYPDGLKGEEIPLIARIVAVADVYDALVTERPYKKAWSMQQAIDYLVAQKDAYFDPKCVDAFVSRLDQVARIQEQYRDTREISNR
ncbi:MAG: response regulator [Gammaproteobacteria bacterium]|nr:response regulator [Gammaproteobacteria bacterium]NIR83068.1 response regulator [Gammaproteobacteria bacterium]NIR90730.1 response regulator [Gammaproteobacteria bacterium]NIU04221.1 response regulator [Gammaproteobacteria bacterium]NIV51513.1 response regulator [Gammaproteobacteria bacterium]